MACIAYKRSRSDSSLVIWLAGDNLQTPQLEGAMRPFITKDESVSGSP